MDTSIPLGDISNRGDYYQMSIKKRLKANPFSSLHDIIYDLLLDDIISLRWLPGKRITERDIAGAMCVSRTPVRAAIFRLQQEHYVTCDNKKGVYASIYARKQIDDFLNLRKALESFAVKSVIFTLTSEQYNRLCYLAELLDKCTLDSLASFTNLDTSFHEYLVACTGNWYLIDVYKQLSTRLILFRNYLTMFAKEDIVKIINRQEHLMLCKLIKFKNADAAAAFIKTHIEALQDLTVDKPCEVK